MCATLPSPLLLKKKKKKMTFSGSLLQGFGHVKSDGRQGRAVLVGASWCANTKDSC